MRPPASANGLCQKIAGNQLLTARAAIRLWFKPKKASHGSTSSAPALSLVAALNALSNSSAPRTSKNCHIPTDLVVAQEASAVETSSRLGVLLLHNFGTRFVAP